MSYLTANESFDTINEKQLQEMIKEGVPVIDIRREDEFRKYGIIEGSHKLTFFDNRGEYDINTWMTAFTQIVEDKDTPFVIYCAHANRTKVIAKFLVEEFGYTNVSELDGGINYGWIDKGLQTVRTK